MRCKTCKRTINSGNRRHNQTKQQCARCHYLGQNSAYPGGKKQDYCKRGHKITEKIWNGKPRRDCVICQIDRVRQINIKKKLKLLRKQEIMAC